MARKVGTCVTLALGVALLGMLWRPAGAQEAAPPANMFQNPGFESGPTPWGPSAAPGTEAEFKVSDEDAAEGEHSMLIRIRSAASWGYQFGQRVAAGQRGKTYTFAVLAKSVGAPVVVQLEIERAGSPYDRAGRSGPTMLRADRWTEVHTTFTVMDDFPQGWYAYVSCAQPDARFRLDAFRLWEGEYVPYGPEPETALEEPEGPKNLFANPDFELGTAAWRPSASPGTIVDFQVTDDMAAEGERSALLALGAVSGWGLQFGQQLPGGRKGKTYTFAALARSVGGPVTVQLEIERPADPWDRAARGQPVTLTEDRWTELHTTFTVATDFPEGWAAYVSCTQPNARFRLDMLRLCEGEYVAYGQEVKKVLQAAAPIKEPEPEVSDAAQAVLEPLPPMVRLFDTRRPASSPLALDAPAHADQWAELPEGLLQHEFAGDAVLLNNRVAAVFRRGAPGVELYSVSSRGLKLRAVLTPVATETVAQLSSASIRTNGPDAGAVDIDFATGGGKQVRIGCELHVGQLFVRTEPRGGVKALRIEAPCRFGVLPDFFADDVVLDATRLTAAEGELPGENFCLHMLPDRDAIVMAVWDTSDEDIRVELSGDGPDRVIKASEVPYSQDGSVRVAVLEGRRIWHAYGVQTADAGRVVRLNWQVPFTAHWRVDWTRHNGLIDSWEMLVAQPNGSFRKPSFGGYEGGVPQNRERWTTVIGSFKYPCWLEADGQACLEPMGGVLRFVGPAIIYPINRVRETPLDVYTVTDVVRETLGVGPCEYILDLEGQRTVRQGLATCPVRDLLDAIYARGDQKRRRADVEKALEDVIVFIRFIRGRIQHYQDFGHEILAYLAEQKAAHPELAGPIAELEELAAAIDENVAARAPMIKTPEHAAELARQFRATLLDYEGTDAAEKCKTFTAAWVEIGGNQDHLVGESRWAVRALRQRAGLIMAEDPRMAEIGREIRRRAQEAMRNPASYESPRH